MNAVLRSLFDVSRYTRQADRARARLLYSVTLFIVAVFTVYAVFVPEGSTQTSILQRALSGNPFSLLSLIGLYGGAIYGIFEARRGRMDRARYMPPLMWMLSGVLLGFTSGFDSPDDGTQLMALVVLAAVFAGERGLQIFVPISIVLLVLGAARQSMIGGDNLLTTDDAASIALQVLGVSAILFAFLRTTRTFEAETITQASEERLRLATLITQIASNILRHTDLNDTLNSAVNEIRLRYPRAYHVQIFLLDDSRRTAQLAASTGDVGRLLLARNHALPVGGQSVIGQVTASGVSVVARANTAETIHRRNEFLPETVAEAAFPLRIGDLVIGALDMQSVQEDAFNEDDLPLFQSLADNIAIAIDNARLFKQSETRSLENQQLADQANTALREVERLNRELTEQSWTGYITTQGANTGFTLDVPTGVTRSYTDWTATLSEAIRFNHIVQRQTTTGVILSVPIAVRGQVIGAMEFEIEGDDPPLPEDIDMLSEVSERLGSAVENGRLYQQSRRSAQREATLNTISTRLQTTNSVSDVLSEAARSLRESLGANKVAIRLGAPPAHNGDVTNGGNERHTS